MIVQTLPPFYGAVFIMRKPSSCTGMLHIDLWRFKSQKSGRTYLIDVEVYQHHVYGIKFYLKAQATSKERFSYNTGDYEPRRIVLTCLKVMERYFSNDSHSSFAFVGASSIGEGKSCTKRFRFYRAMVNTYFGQSIFEHLADERHSTYLLLRKSEIENGAIDKLTVEKFFKDIYFIYD